jgi:predicted ATP-binding protein involved in virulence
MKINSIHLKNFRCFIDTKVILHENLSVFVGVNASGKTALLEALKIGAGAFFYAWRNTDGLEQYHISESDVRVDKKLQETKYFRPVDLEFKGKIGNKSCSWARRYKKKTSSSQKDLGELSYSVDDLLLAYKLDKVVTLPVLLYFSTERIWGERKDYGVPNSGSRISAYYNCLKRKSATFFIENEFEKMETASLQNDALKLGKNYFSLELIRRISGKCVPDCERVYYDFDYKEIALQFKNGTILPVSKLSDGQKSILLIAMGIAFQCGMLNPHLEHKADESPGIVLIDEVDLHLHPKWQREILPVLTSVFKEIQFIVTTHSPQILSSVKKENVFIIENQEIKTINNFVEGRDSNSILREIFDIMERPDLDNKRLMEFYVEIERGDYNKSFEIYSELKNKWGETDPEIVKAELYLLEIKK